MRSSKLFKSRKAQITIFIIIGIILLFSSALIMYIKNKVTNTQPAPTIIQNVPEDLVGMKNYIESCIFSTGKEAVTLIGAHGGYIYPEKFEVNYNPINPTESSGLEILPNSRLVVPYWYYLETPNNNGNVKFSTKRPDLSGDDPSTIESQITDYVNNNLKTCINDFSAYTLIGYDVKELGSIKTKTTITRDDVVIDVTWPLEAGRDNPKKIDRFLVTLPVNLRQVYNFADLFIKEEVAVGYIEMNTLNLITLASGKDETKLPPLGDFSFKKEAPITWILPEVKKKMETVLYLYTPLLRVIGTDNDVRYFYKETMTQTVMDKMRIPLSASGARYPLNIQFTYLNWPIYLDVTPKKGSVIKAKDQLGDFGVLGMMGVNVNQYEFYYDISYPILIELTDPNAFDDEGYGFMFAMESNIRNNKPLNANYTLASYPSSTPNFMCDEEQKRSGNITINVFDKVTQKPVDKASIAFSAGKRGCDIGLARINNDSTISSSTERYPKGIGILAVKAVDYASYSMLYAVGDNKTDVLNISLYPAIEKNVSLKIFHVDKVSPVFPFYSGCGSWTFNTTPQDIRPNETVNIVLTKVKTEESPDMIMGAFSYDGSIENDTEKRAIKIIPGKYELMIITTYSGNITFPAQPKTYGSGRKKTNIIIEAKSMDTYNEGIMQMNKDTYYFEVKPEDLYTNTTLEFHALAYDIISVPERCRSQDPSDITPSPDINTFMESKKKILLPAFVQIE